MLALIWDELRRETEPPNGVIRAAIIYKAIGSVLLVVSAALLFGIGSHTLASDTIRAFLVASAMDADHLFVQRLLIRLGLLTHHDAVVLGLIALLYAALEAAESSGLARRRRWAEYLTFLATILLLPPEVAGLLRHPSPGEFLLFVVNLALAIYLVSAKRLFHYGGDAPKPDDPHELVAGSRKATM